MGVVGVVVVNGITAGISFTNGTDLKGTSAGELFYVGMVHANGTSPKNDYLISATIQIRRRVRANHQLLTRVGDPKEGGFTRSQTQFSGKVFCS